MIYGVIGDIHSNYEALTAVIDEFRREGIHDILCVGDIVGYAADPAKCIDVIRELNCTIVAGNHDYAVAGKFPLSYFNPDARTTVLWTIEQLSSDQISFLESLPLKRELQDITLVHASLNRPELFDYITTGLDAQLNLDILGTRVCFYGHTHVPAVFLLREGDVRVERGPLIDLKGVDKAIINVGSVGQHRDWDNRPSFVIYNAEKMTIEIRRIKYNVNDAVKKIHSAHLPKVNARRLSTYSI